MEVHKMATRCRVPLGLGSPEEPPEAVAGSLEGLHLRQQKRPQKFFVGAGESGMVLSSIVDIHNTDRQNINKITENVDKMTENM
jgi:hypothetical protein